MNPIRKISIVIPTYNNKSLFIKAIRSVLNQDLQPHEIIISDDSSNNSIEEWIKQQNSHLIKYYRNYPAKGAVNNWNSGIEKATGDWIIVLHHDEEFGSSNYLRILSSHMDNSDILISDIRVRENQELRKGRINGYLKRILLKMPASQLIINSIGPCACICFNRRILQKFDNNLTWLVDVEWYSRLLYKAQNNKYDPSMVIISNHGHTDQITSSINISSAHKEDVKYLKKKYKNNLIITFILRFSSIFYSIKTKISPK